MSEENTVAMVIDGTEAPTQYPMPFYIRRIAARDAAINATRAYRKAVDDTLVRMPAVMALHTAMFDAIDQLDAMERRG